MNTFPGPLTRPEPSGPNAHADLLTTRVLLVTGVVGSLVGVVIRSVDWFGFGAGLLPVALGLHLVARHERQRIARGDDPLAPWERLFFLGLIAAATFLVVVIPAMFALYWAFPSWFPDSCSLPPRR